MTSDEAREMLGHLGNALGGATAPFKGCMSPVRVRLVRADGGLLEKQGCRSELGWSRAVSETVNVFVTASVHGYGGAPASVSEHASHAVSSAPSGG